MQVSLESAKKCVGLLEKLDKFATSIYGVTHNKEDVLDVRSHWQSDLGFIDDFILENENLSQEEIATLKSWRGRVPSYYVLIKYTPEYTLLYSLEDNRFFGVLGLVGGLEKEIPSDTLPVLVQATLLPYDNNIVSDGAIAVVDYEFDQESLSEIAKATEAASDAGQIILQMPYEMGIDEIVESFADKAKFPYEALSSAVMQKDEITPILVEMVKDLSAEDFECEDGECQEYIIALLLLAKFKETSAFEAVMEIVKLPLERLEEIFGELFWEVYHKIIAGTYNGDLSAIKNLIEDSSIDPTVRGTLIDSLLVLFAIGKVSREELVNYFRSLFNSILIQDVEFSGWLVNAACSLYPKDLYKDIMTAFDNGFVDEEIISRSEVEGAILEDQEEWIKENILVFCNYAPVQDDISTEILWMYQEDQELDEEESDESDLDEDDLDEDDLDENECDDDSNECC